MNYENLGMSAHDFLTVVYDADPVAAVQIANRWGGNSVETHARYAAAWHIASTQTVYQLCVDCHWPVVPGDSHLRCKQATTDMRLRAMGFDPDAINDDVDDSEHKGLNEEDLLTSTVYTCALRTFNGDHARAREAAEMCPGDFA